jgi:hypothetical protein
MASLRRQLQLGGRAARRATARANCLCRFLRNITTTAIEDVIDLCTSAELEDKFPCFWAS